MSIGLIIILAALITTIAMYIDKKIVNDGISRHDYFFYMCMTMVPFALIMCFIEQIKFEFSIIPFILLGFAMVLRYLKQHTIVGCLTHLNPHEAASYMSLTVVIAFLIDFFTGLKEFTYIHFLAVILTVGGVFLLANVKLKIKSLQKDLIIRIICDVAMGYVTFFILKYWSNAIYILLLNFALTFIFVPTYKMETHKKNKSIIKWVFLQQFFGFFEVYLANFLASKAVTFSLFVKPVSLVFTMLMAFGLKMIKQKPNIKDVISIIMIAIGILLINTT